LHDVRKASPRLPAVSTPMPTARIGPCLDSGGACAC
jgi:hypothetical protein